MGCYDSTCMVSNLSIGYHDEIVMLVLIENPFQQDKYELMYPSDLWAPFLAPIFGKYDDYGGIEPDADQPAVDLALEYLNKHRHDTDEITLEQFCRRELSEAYLKSPYGKTPVRVSRMFMHRRLWTHLTTETVAEDYNAGFQDTVIRDSVRNAYEKALKKTEDDLDQYRENNFTEEVARIHVGDRYISEFCGGVSSYSYGGNFIFAKGTALFEELVLPVIALKGALHVLRKSFQPQQTIGEQHTPPERAMPFLQACLEMLQEEKHRRDIENGEDE